MTNVSMLTDAAKLLGKKKEHLAAILALTREQTDVIDEDEVGGLLENIRRKQEHIDAIARIEQQLPDREILMQDHAFVRTAIDCNRLIEEIQKLDAANYRKAEDRLVFLRGQAQKVSRGRKAGAQYDDAPTMGAVYFDQRQ